MAKFELKGYNSYSGCDIVVTARLNVLTGTKKELKEKVYTLGSLQTLSVSTHQDKRPVRVIGSVNALDYVMGQRTIAGSLVFAVFDQHFATEMFNDLEEATDRTFFLPDELPALDLTITFANEYGRQSRMAIYGVRIINEGQVMSINDLYTENTYQFVATAMEPLKKGVQIGSSNSINKSSYISSSQDNVEVQSYITGEEIYKQKQVINIDESTKVSLIANVEQPTYANQEGIVKLYISPTQSSGTISILDKKKNKVVIDIPVAQNSSQYSTFMKSGDYSAWYHNNGQILSNTVSFIVNTIANIDYSYNDTPVIESITDTTLTALSNNPTHTVGVCLDINTLKEIESDINSRIFKFTNLSPNTKYRVYTREKDSFSKTVDVKTLEEQNQNLIAFKEYVRCNKNLLSKDFDSYQELLDKLIDDNYLYTLTKDKSFEAKELIFMAIKYKNEITSVINSDNVTNMPKKNIENIYGNTFNFDNGVAKANIFINRNKKDYFESSEVYPIEVTYTGKPNSLYNVISVNDDYIKSPKYTFYTFSDNDKADIEKQFGDVNVLNSLDLIQLANNKLSNESLKCLTAKENKTKDINLLKAPSGYINESCDLIANISYKDILGLNKTYYLCISNLNECLDKTPFRKIEINTTYNNIIIENSLTTINKTDIFAIWIEDEQFNVVSELGFVSTLDDTEDLNDYIVKQEIESIAKKIENNLSKSGLLTDIINSINYNSIDIKDIYKELALIFVTQKEEINFDLIYELFKVKFNSICTNKEKYKTVIYNTNSRIVTFEEAKDVELVHIAIKKDDYKVEVTTDNQSIVDSNYDFNLFYLISSNPVIKSGFILINNDTFKSHLINLEVI